MRSIGIHKIFSDLLQPFRSVRTQRVAPFLDCGLRFFFGFGFSVGLVNSCSSGVPEEHKSPRSCLSTCLPFFFSSWRQGSTVRELWNVARNTASSKKKTDAIVDDGRARCIVPAPRGPPLLKMWTQDRSSNPYQVFSSWMEHPPWSLSWMVPTPSIRSFVDALNNLLRHGQCHLTARYGTQLVVDVNIEFHVARERSVVDSVDSHAGEIGLEQHSDDVSVWELVDKTDPPIHTEPEEPLRSHRGWSQHRDPSSCTQRSLGKWSCHLRARHCRTDLWRM